MYLSEWPKPRTLTTPNAGKGVEQQELSSTAGGNTKWHSHFGQFDGFLQNETYRYHMIQQPCFLVFTQRNWKLRSEEKPVRGYLSLLYS